MRTRNGGSSVWVRRVLPICVVAALGGCSSMKPPVPEKTFAQVSKRDSDSKEKQTVLSRATEDFYDRYERSVDPERASPANAQAMFNAGRTLIELNCEEYLDAIGQSAQAAGNLRQQTSLVGGLSSVLMGVGGASAGGVAGVASTFSFLGASMDAYSMAYLFSDAGTSIIRLVHSAQELFMDEVNRDLQSTVLDHAGAMHILMGYQSICRPAKIRALVNSAINRAQVVAEIARDNGVDEEVMGVLRSLRLALDVPVSEGDAIKLYARVLVPQEKGVTLASGMQVDKKKIESLANIFLPLGLKSSKLGDRWKSALTTTTPPMSLAMQQELARSANGAIRNAETMSAAAKAARADAIASLTLDVTLKSQQAINAVLTGGYLDKAKDAADAAKRTADNAFELLQTTSATLQDVQAATAAVEAARNAAIATQSVVDKAIASRNNQPPRMSQFSLPIIGISR